MVGIDDLLIAFATAAGKSAGEAIVNELIKGITNNLATKQDLANAVYEIKDYIYQELQAVEQRAIVADVDSAIRTIDQFNSSRNRIVLAEQETQTLLNHAASELLNNIQSDPLYPWKQFVVISRFVAVNTTFWSIKALQFNDQAELLNFAKALSEGAYLLTLCQKKLHEIEDETVSEISVEWRFIPDLTPDPSVTLRPNGEEYSRGVFKLIRGRYIGGFREIKTQEINTTGEKNDDSVMSLTIPLRNNEIERINRESIERLKIYDSLQVAIDALNNMLARLSGPLTAIQASFNRSYS